MFYVGGPGDSCDNLYKKRKIKKDFVFVVGFLRKKKLKKLIPIFGFLLSPFLMCVCLFQPRTICFQYIRICFSLERKCVFDLIILILIILVSYLGD